MGVKRTFKQLWPSSTNRLRRAARAYVENTLSPQEMLQIEQVPGCLNREQGTLLCYLAAYAPGTAPVVEIGSFMGRSTVWLARGVQRSRRGNLVAIDPHDGHERPEVEPGLDSYNTFRQTLEENSVTSVVEVRRQRSHEVAAEWDRPIRLLWVDGSHDYDDVLADLEGFTPHVVVGGFVAMHDTRSRRFPGVRKAMLEFFTGHPDFREVVDLRNMAVYQKETEAG